MVRSIACLGIGYRECKQDLQRSEAMLHRALEIMNRHPATAQSSEKYETEIELAITYDYQKKSISWN